jgi:Cu-Zn family superoxide dismutase
MELRRWLALPLGLATGVTLIAQGQPSGSDQAQRVDTVTASATLIDGMRRAVGEARLEEARNGVLLRLDLTNATPGVHALHLHQDGTCEPPAFTSAGGHFAPDRKSHGFLNVDGPHAGDLPNIHVPSTLMLTLEYLIPGVTLRAGPRTLLDGNGTALVMHAGPDDYLTEPGGDAEARLACGRIVQNTSAP